MARLLSAIRLAVGSGAQTHALEQIEGEPDANASISEPPQAEANSPGGIMSGIQTLTGAASPASPATTPSAAAPGGQDGAQAATDRLMTVFTADGIKGDAGRMSAAFDLAASAPGMTADAVVSFVATHVPAAGANSSAPASDPPPPAPAPAAKTAPAVSYEQQRLNAAALAQPGGTSANSAQPKISASSIFEMRRNALKGA
ncbi:hypothetical protein [Rhizobium sp. FKY42]|uniref:hypothetical protein n=1 Tax=Rhizobium sp. FKY42 TaxID=2562310 RepID=UPI0010BF7CBB|nr:hypothetical protein [Rhizobium sp. FKY42]